MKKIVFVACTLFLCLFSLPADEIKLESFPRGKWLDTQWQAYWVFGDDTIRLLDVRDQEIYDFTGIVQNMKVKKTGSVLRLSFDCSQAKRSYRFDATDGTKTLMMTIQQANNSLSYHIEMPAISDAELAVYKETVIAAETAEPGAVLTTEQKVAKSVDALVASAYQVDFTRMETLSREYETAGLTDRIIGVLEAEAAKVNAPPAIYIALSAMYGRKGLKTMEYVTLELAEKAPVPIGIKINIALVHGRKQLLASSSDAASFMVGDIEVIPSPSEARIILDGIDKGNGPRTFKSIEAGSHTLKITAPDHDAFETRLVLGVGQTITQTVELVAHPGWLEYTSDPADATVSVDGVDYTASPIQVSPGEHSIIVSSPDRETVQETVTVAPGKTVTKNWTLARKARPSLIKAIRVMGKVSYLPLDLESYANTGSNEIQSNHSTDSYYTTEDIYGDQPVLGYGGEAVLLFRFAYAKVGVCFAEIGKPSDLSEEGPDGPFTSSGQTLTWRDVTYGAGVTIPINPVFSVAAGLTAFTGFNTATWEVFVPSDGSTTGADSSNSNAVQGDVSVTCLLFKRVPITLEAGYIFAGKIWLHGLTGSISAGYQIPFGKE